MKYILDNSVLSAFAKIRRLYLLKRIFDNKVVLIPKEVYNVKYALVQEAKRITKECELVKKRLQHEGKVFIEGK